MSAKHACTAPHHHVHDATDFVGVVERVDLPEPKAGLQVLRDALLHLVEAARATLEVRPHDGARAVVDPEDQPRGVDVTEVRFVGQGREVLTDPVDAVLVRGPFELDDLALTL